MVICNSSLGNIYTSDTIRRFYTDAMWFKSNVLALMTYVNKNLPSNRLFKIDFAYHRQVFHLILINLFRYVHMMIQPNVRRSTLSCPFWEKFIFNHYLCRFVLFTFARFHQADKYSIFYITLSFQYAK